jgi:hypothetical protein
MWVIFITLRYWYFVKPTDVKKDTKLKTLTTIIATKYEQQQQWLKTLDLN